MKINRETHGHTAEVAFMSDVKFGN